MGVICEFDGVTRELHVRFQTFDLVLYNVQKDRLCDRQIVHHTNDKEEDRQPAEPKLAVLYFCDSLASLKPRRANLIPPQRGRLRMVTATERAELLKI